MQTRINSIIAILLAAAATLCGQPGPAQTGPRPDGALPPPAGAHGPLVGPSGKWWDSTEMAKKLGLTADQQKKMDDVFQQSRLRLIDLHAALEREEAILEPLMQAPQPDDSKVLPQIDKIAEARAELEKANARLLLGIRHVLSPEQWRMLQEDLPRPRRLMRPSPADGAAAQPRPFRPQR